MSEYQQIWDQMKGEISDTVVLRTRDNAFIPMDADNIDCQEYMRWLDEGNYPNPPRVDPVPPIEELPPPDITQVNAQVQDIDARLTALEDQTYGR